MAMPDGAGLLAGTQSKELLKPTSSGLLKPTTSGLDTMASMELALPGVRKNDQQALGQQDQRGGGGSAAAPLSHGMGNAGGVNFNANRSLGPYAR